MARWQGLVPGVVVAFALLLAACGEDGPAARFTGRIVEEDTGAPVPGASLHAFIKPPEEASASGQSTGVVLLEVPVAADGRFEGKVPASFSKGGTIHLVAQAPGHREWRRLWGETPEESAIPFRPGDAVEVPVRMKRGRTITGLVTDSAGRPVEGAGVGMVLSGPGWCSWPHTFGVGDRNWPPPVVSDREGRFRILGFPAEDFEKIPGARWVLILEHETLGPAVVQALEKMPAPGGIVEVRALLPPGLSIRGKVAGKDGAPIAGAEVIATGEHRPDEPTCVRVRATAKSGADGGFTLGGLGRRKYEIQAKAEGFVPSTAVAVHTSRSLPEDLRFDLVPGETLEGRVLLPGGEPAAEAEVRLRMPEAGLSESTRTGKDGSFRFTGLPGGKGELLAHDLFMVAVEVPCAPVEVRVGKPRPLDVVLRKAEDGSPIPPPGNLYFFGPGYSSGRPLDSPEGRVRLRDLVPAEYELHADVPGRAVVVRKVRLEAGEGPEEVVVDLPVGLTLRGRVTDERGGPVAGAEVHAWGTGPHDERKAKTDAEGRYVLAGLDPGAGDEGREYLVAASAPGRATSHLRAAWRLSDLPSREKDFRLGPGITVRGRVETPEGLPIAGLLVKALEGEAVEGTRCPLPSAVTDADGRYVLEHVAAGAAWLAAADQKKKVEAADGKEVPLDWVLEP